METIRFLTEQEMLYVAGGWDEDDEVEEIVVTGYAPPSCSSGTYWGIASTITLGIGGVGASFALASTAVGVVPAVALGAGSTMGIVSGVYQLRDCWYG